eukprot:6443345-Pyramimonas_sp.AAC.1
MVQARDNNVKCPPGWPEHEKARGSSSGQPCSIPPGWPAHVKARGPCSRQPCQISLGGLDT